MEEYEELGLTVNESKVYGVLVRFGKLGAGEVARESGVSYSKVYNVLDSLINKGLARVIPEKSKKFVPGSPGALMELIEKKQERLERAKEKAKELKKFYDVKEKNPVVMEIGRKGFYKIVEEAKLRSVKKHTYVVKYSTEFREDWLRRTEDDLKRGIIVKNLVRYDEETKKNVKHYMEVNKNVRKIENDGVAMYTKDNEEVMISLIKSNVTLLIRDKPFAKLLKKMFLETYKNAEKIE